MIKLSEWKKLGVSNKRAMRVAEEREQKKFKRRSGEKKNVWI